jgi:TolB-like protein/Flp pilus assembly protein TadD
VRSKGSEQLSPYEAVLRSFGYYERVTPQEHAVVRAGLERAVQEAPRNADGWAMLAMIYGEEFRFRFNLQPDPLGRSLQAAQRAVDAAPSNHYAHLALAQALFFRQEFGEFRNAAERALKLNPMDGATCQYLGHLLAFSGDWEYGCTVGARSRELNPHHPAWYWALPMLDAYRKGDYQGARTFAVKFGKQGLWLTTTLLAALHGQLGELEAAQTRLEELLLQEPDSAAIARDGLSKWYPAELVERLIEGLRKAGLDVLDAKAKKESHQSVQRAGAPQAPVSKAPEPSPSQARDVGAESPIDSLAVLPFENLSGDPEMDYLSEGITEILINNLSQIRKLRLAPRGVMMRYKGRDVPAETVAAELNVRAVLSGRVNQRGENLIVAAELLDVAKMAQIWGGRYTRKVSDILALQEEIAAEISEKLRMELSDEFKKPAAGKPAYDKDAYQLYLKALYFSNKWSPQDLKKAIEFSRQAIELDPSIAPAHATMAMSYAMLGFYGMLPPREALPRAKSAAQKALAIDEGLAEAHAALALTYIFYDWDWANGEREAERAIEANPNLAFAHLADSVWPIVLGKFEQATVAQQRALDLDPLSPANNLVLGAWLMFARKYDRAIEQLRKAIELDPLLARPREVLALVYAHAGNYDLAVAECHMIGTLPGGQAVSRPLLGYVYALSGRTEEARKILEELKPALKDDLLLIWRTAFLCAALKELDMAFELLNRLCDERFGLITYIKGYPTLDNLRSDPRYAQLLQRMRLPA